MTFNETWERAHGYAWRMWDDEGKSSLHGMLIELKNAHEEEVAAARDAFPLDLPTYDVAGNERHKAACALKKWEPKEAIANIDRERYIKLMYQILTDNPGGNVTAEEAATAVRDRLVELLES